MKTRTNDELKKSCRFIIYEILELHHSLFRMADNNLIPANRNCYIECYAIHLRCLMEFIKDKPSNHPKKNYIRALDYLDSGSIEEWNKFKSKHQATLNKIKEKADIQLAHLSYDREKYKGKVKGWGYEFCNVIDECLLKWSSLADKSKTDEDLIEVISHFQKITPALLKKILLGVYKKQIEQIPPPED